MGNLADLIEQYLRVMINQQNRVELQRRELAKMFRCAPSQINYVLETRFTLDRGYLVESKRGGGGFIRITLLHWDTPESLPQLIERLVPDEVGLEEVEFILTRLVERGLVELEKAQLAAGLIAKEFADLPAEQADYLRAKLIKTLLLVLGTR